MGRLSPPAKIVLLYLILGVGWILLTDVALFRLVADPAVRARVESLKGILFVLLSAGLLYLIVHFFFGRLNQTITTFRQVIDLVPYMIFAKDEQGRFLLANQATAAAYGTTVEALTGRRLSAVHPIHREVEQFMRDDREVIATGRPKHVPEERFTDAQGHEHLLEVTKIPVMLHGVEPAALGVSIDITRHHRVEEAEREARVEAERDSRAKADLIDILSHELRIPLNAQELYLKLFRTRLTRDHVADKELLDHIEQQTGRLAAQVNELVEVAELEHGSLPYHPLPTDLRALVESTVEDVRRKAPQRTISLDLPAAARGVLVEADPALIGQVLANLLDNALKFTPEGSPVAVQLTVEQRVARVCVTDEGPGIPVAEQPRIFTRFYRGPGTMLEQRGLGLGLYISRRIVERHGGRIWFRSAVGQGSTFCFSLPTVGPGV